LTACSLAVTAWAARSRFGYYLMAIRENEDTALSVGVNATRSKVSVLAISAALTAVGGALYASLFLYIGPRPRPAIRISNEIAIVAMLGGAGTVLGPIVGAIILETASEVFKNVFHEAHLLIYGVLILLVVLFLPEGIVGALKTLRRRRGKGGPWPSSRSTGCRSTSAACARSTTCRSRCTRRRWCSSSGRTAPARPRCSTSSPGSCAPTRARSATPGGTSRASRPTGRRGSASGARSRSSSRCAT